MTQQSTSLAHNDNYFLPANYITNKAITYDTDARTAYWDKNRRLMSQSYQRAAYNWVGELLDTFNCTNLADVGCGFADKLYALAQKNKDIDFCGIDQPNIINVCKDVYDAGNWIAVNIEENPAIENQKFDFVVSSDVIKHLEDPDKLLNFIKSIVKKDGHILISTPDRDVIRGRNCLISPNKSHVREWNGPEFKEYLESRGLKVIEHRILPGISPFFSITYLRHRVQYWIKGININFNQAVLLKLAD